VNAPSRVYLSPGMFGFARLASFEYFEHVVRAIEERWKARGRSLEVHVCEVHPTASVRRRAGKLAAMIAETCGNDGGPIHIVGHSTGGLDARLVTSPSAHLGRSAARLEWTPRICSVTTVNTPHYGTPLASFFATVSGQRLLYAVSALTVAGLKLGAPPLAATSALMAAFGRVQIGKLEIELVERTVEAVIRVLDEASSRELRAWLKLLRDDQGGIVQLMPEAMDLFQAGVEDREGVRYQCVATYAPENAVTDWIAALRSPWSAASATIFAALYKLTARQDERYPCCPHDGSAVTRVRALLGEAPEPHANDGIVPLYSQIWGELIWVGKADHLDIVGHFPGPPRARGQQTTGPFHTDWLSSGARFTRVRFDVVMDRIVGGMLVAEELRRRAKGAGGSVPPPSRRSSLPPPLQEATITVLPAVPRAPRMPRE
jgi:triacylglycerol lipase